MLNRKLALLATAPLLCAPLLVVSCGASEQDNSIKQIDTLSPYTFEDIDWTNANYFEGETGSWNDGDTVTWSNLGATGGDGNLVTSERIRVGLLDSPEMGGYNTAGDYENTSGLERHVAEASTAYAKELMPTGTKFRAYYGGTDAYGRNAGTLFFGENFERSFATEMFWQGLALNEYNDLDVILANTVNPVDSNDVYVTSFANMLASQDARDNDRGFWKFPIDSVYVERGLSDIGPIEIENAIWEDEDIKNGAGFWGFSEWEGNYNELKR